MENKDFSFDQSMSEAEPLTLPHFDDEATVQSARPVVPLHEVKRIALTRRNIVLGAALCLAAVVGALVASIIYSQPSQRAPEEAAATIPDTTDSEDFVAPSGEASGSTVNPEDAVASNTETAASDEADSERPVNRVISRDRQPKIANPRVEKQPDLVVSQPKIQDRGDLDVRAEEELLREQRREARRARRERRANDGLTRIREIFEGSPRP
ncbi:MAG TPA: hypothetical protein VFR80_02230 [Pyrinomonadaceae bacterium]|nr:hypothetical protein [Pyrinomonadaceae bacterium]